MQSNVINTLHARENIVSLVKTALSAENVQLLYKGDVAGHEFHGNQWTGGVGGQDAQVSLNRTGGFSYNPLTGEVPSTGNMVSIYPERSFAVDHADYKPSDLAKYVEQNKDVLDKADHFVGGWLDEDTGKVCLDVSVRAATHEEATKLSLDHDQKGYFNNETKQYHEVNADATSGGVLKGELNVKTTTEENVCKSGHEESRKGYRRAQYLSDDSDRLIQAEKSHERQTSNLIKVALSPINGISLYKEVR